MFNLKKLPGYSKGEKVELFLRRHWFIFLKVVLGYLALALLPVVFYLVVLGPNVNALVNDVTYPLSVILIGSFYLFVWLFFFNAFLDHYLDIWIVTNKRIINIEQKGLFSRMVSEQKLNKVQDVTSQVKGFIPTFLNYGHVFVQSAGTISRFDFKDVSHATDIAEHILKLVEEARQDSIEQKTTAQVKKMLDK